ncbi:hypothetical protein G7046_g5554 [Stylonectria norvegica]|nr:hypothetical protein G7046_g5554 [Stylonectria norvegica]
MNSITTLKFSAVFVSPSLALALYFLLSPLVAHSYLHVQLFSHPLTSHHLLLLLSVLSFIPAAAPLLNASTPRCGVNVRQPTPRESPQGLLSCQTDLAFIFLFRHQLRTLYLLYNFILKHEVSLYAFFNLNLWPPSIYLPARRGLLEASEIGNCLQIPTSQSHRRHPHLSHIAAWQRVLTIPCLTYLEIIPELSHRMLAYQPNNGNPPGDLTSRGNNLLVASPSTGFLLYHALPVL